MKPQFLNVDLEVISGVDPTPLSKALGENVSVLYCGRHKPREFLAAFEVCSVRSSLEKRLGLFCDLLDSLPRPAARIWRMARRRTFDIGVESGDERPALALRIAPETLARVTALGATITVTVYPHSP